MSYKSKHTGAQVDEAVSKVLNSEVGGGADWNAKEGEAGYIENKPFEFIDKHENSFFYDVDYNPNYIVWDAYSSYDSSVIQILDYDGFPHYICLDDKTDGSFYNMDNIFNSSVLNYKWINDELCIEIPSYVFNEGEDVRTCLNELKKYSTGGILRKISDIYLPNTVLKTTPQKLSDTDKNQALANLGIDPIVWKYICNPLAVRDGGECPEELIENGELKYKIPAMYVVLPPDDDLNDIYRAPSKYVRSNKITTFSVNGNSYYVATLSDITFTIEEVV